jgi:hypothetical protein
MAQTKNSMVNMLLLGVAVVALVVLVYFLAVQSQTEDSESQTQTANVTNAAPTVDTVYFAANTSHGYNPANDVDQFTVVEEVDPSDRTTVVVYVKLEDTNGCLGIDDPSNLGLTLYKSGDARDETCIANDNNCYHYNLDGANTTITGCTGAADVDLWAQIIAPMQIFADATHGGSPDDEDQWVAHLTVTDDDAATAENDASGFDLVAFTAIGDMAPVTYDATGLGEISNSELVEVVNKSNVSIDMYQSVTDPGNSGMECGVDGADGVIPWSNVKFGATSDFDYATQGQALVGHNEGQSGFNLNLGHRQDGDPSYPIASLYAKVQIPASGVANDCSNSVIISATSANTY